MTDATSPTSPAAPPAQSAPREGDPRTAMVALFLGIFFLLASLPLSAFVLLQADEQCAPRLELPDPPCDFVAAHIVGGLLVAATGLPATVLAVRARRYIDPRLPFGRRRGRTAQVLGILTVVSPVVVIGGIRLLLWLMFRKG